MQTNLVPVLFLAVKVKMPHIIRSLKVNHSFSPPVHRGSPRGSPSRSVTYWRQSWLLSRLHGKGRDSSLSHKCRNPGSWGPKPYNLFIFQRPHLHILSHDCVPNTWVGAGAEIAMAAYKQISRSIFSFFLSSTSVSANQKCFSYQY